MHAIQNTTKTPCKIIILHSRRKKKYKSKYYPFSFLFSFFVRHRITIFEKKIIFFWTYILRLLKYKANETYYLTVYLSIQIAVILSIIHTSANISSSNNFDANENYLTEKELPTKELKKLIRYCISVTKLLAQYCLATEKYIL